MVNELPNGPAGTLRMRPPDMIPSGPFRSLRLRSLVALAVVVLVIPVWGYGLFAAWQFARTTRATIEGDGIAAARGIANALTFRITALQGTMRSLAQSYAFERGEWSQLYVQAHAFAQAQDIVIGFAEASGRVIFNTNAPYGAELTPLGPQSRFREALETGEVQITDVMYGSVSRTWLLALTRPLQQADGGKFVLAVAFDSARHIADAMEGVRLQPGWVAAVLDKQGRIAGREPQGDFIGQMATEDARRIALTGQPARGIAMTMTGERALLFSQPVEGTGWTVLIGVPERTLTEAVQAHVEGTLISGLLLFTASIGLAILIANRFSRKFEALARLALAYRDRSTALVTRPYRVRELADLQRILLLAHEERDRNEARLRQLISDKEMLMQEVHHRVKNSLQLVRGVLSLQARSTGNAEAKEALEAASSRIITIANVHNHLYLGDSINEIMVDDYLTQLTDQLGTSLFANGGERRIRIKAEHVPIRTEAMTSLGLVTTELITNSAKYGAGPIDVQFHLDETEAGVIGVLAVSDRGAGFPENFAFDSTGGLGSRLIDNLVRSSGGTVEIQKRKTGSRVVVRFPLPRPEEPAPA